MSGYDDETALVGVGDATSPTEKTAPARPGRPPMPSMPSKPKGLLVSPKKGIQKLLKSPKYGKKDKKGVNNSDDKTKFISKEDEKEVDKSSEKWLEFEQMQQRIQATMSRTKDNLHKLGSSIDKTITSIASNSPWGIMRQNGDSVEDKEEFSESGGSMSGSESGRSDPRAGWVGFEDNFTVTPNIELGAKLSTLEATPIPSPRHCPVPPHTSRNTSRRSSTGAEELADFLGIATPIPSGEGGDNLPPPPTSASYDMLEGGGGSVSESEDIIGVYSRNPTGTMSGRSSTMSTPTPYDQDMQILESGPATPTEETGPSESAIGLVDEILGISGDEAKRLNTQKEMMGVLEKIQQLAKPKDDDDFLGLGKGTKETSAEDDDPFGLSAKPAETSFTPVGDLFGTPTEESKSVPGTHPGSDIKLEPPPTRESAASPLSDDFDPRSDFNVAVKPVADEAGDVWGDRKPINTNPFASSTVVARPVAQKISSTNPFASAVAAPTPSPKNPFTADVGSTGAAEGNLLFGDASAVAAMDILNVGVKADEAASPGETATESATEPSAAGGASFNPFATITDVDAHAHVETNVPAGGTSDDFDPFQTITGDDAFVDFPGQERKDSSTSGSKMNPFNAESEQVGTSFADFDTAKAESKPTAAPSQTSQGSAQGPTSPVAVSSESSIDMDVELEPLAPFYPAWEGDGWSLFLRQPTKKKLASQRYWKPVYVRIMPNNQGVPSVKIFQNKDSKDVIQSLDMQSCYTLCNMGLQQYDQYGKCHTIKIQYVFYRERVGVKAERITPTLGDLVRVRDFSLKGFKDLVHRPKATMILDKAPQASELLKFGSLIYDDFRTFVRQLEDGLFYMKSGRANAVHQYTKDEITCDIVDEYYVEIDSDGHITFHKARIRVFCLAFLTGMPWVEVGINDKKRQGREVVGRKDIIPIKTEEWIRTEDVELHSSVQVPEWEKEKVLRFRPLDACHYEIMRFRSRPKINKELPLQIRVQWKQSGRRVEIRSDIVIPGYYTHSRRASQTPCEDIQIRIPIPEPWIYLFRVEKRFKYGSLHATRRKPGKIKGLERITQVAQSMLPPSLIEVSSGSAKYEHIFQSIVWRISRLPERNEGNVFVLVVLVFELQKNFK